MTRMDTDEIVWRYRFYPWWNLAGCCFFLAAAGVALIVYASLRMLSVPGVSEDAATVPTDVGTLVFGMVALLLVFILVKRPYPYEICIGGDGTVILKRLLRRTVIKIHDISAIRWTTRSGFNEDAGRSTYRVVLIEHNQGHIELVDFKDAREFTKNLQQLNPSLRVDADALP